MKSKSDVYESSAGKMKLTCLPGFLGLPSDWDKLAHEVVGRCDVSRVDLSRGPDAFLAPSTATDWARGFSARQPQGSILLGYSMGARLAMRALLADPSRYRAAILVSGHPGLTSKEERSDRLQADEAWARRFETEGWQTLMDAWNSQPVLAGSVQIPRKESEYSRPQLAHCLREGSLGRQEDLLPSLLKLKTPILWVVGEKDAKFSALAHRIEQAKPPGSFEIWRAPGAGHRVPWERPQAFAEKVQDWIFGPGLGKSPA